MVVVVVVAVFTNQCRVELKGRPFFVVPKISVVRLPQPALARLVLVGGGGGLLLASGHSCDNGP